MEQIESRLEKNSDPVLSLRPILSNTNLFNKDNNFFTIIKKTENLAGAIYLLTDLFPADEPLRLFLRNQILRVVSLTASFRVAVAQHKNNSLSNLQIGLYRLLSYLRTAYMGGLISNMNFSLLSEELVKLIRENEKYVENFRPEKDSVGENFFKDNRIKDIIKDNSESSEQPTVAIQDKGQDKGHGVLGNRTQSDETRVKLGNFQNEKKLSIGNVANKEKKNERQLTIIDLVKNKKAVSIKDITDYIKDCSEKTVQRELRSMVKSGVLKKEGEKRWSRYSLNL